MPERKRPAPPSEQDLAIWEIMRPDFQKYGYTGLVGYFQSAGHAQIAKWAEKYVDKIVLEVGSGHGYHLKKGRNDYRFYMGLDIDYRLCQTVHVDHKDATAIQGDAYHLPFANKSIDCILSIYNLEHLRHLPDCLAEFHRVLKSDGELLVGLPTEGGFLYNLGRELTTKRHAEKKYGIDYHALVHWEHWNTYHEVVEMLQEKFTITQEVFVPIGILRSVHFNIIGCLQVTPYE